MSPAGPNQGLRVAMFPRGLDGLFFPALDDVAVFALVERGSPDETWLRQFWPAPQVLTYTLDRPRLGIYPTTQEILAHSDIHQVLKQGGVKALLLSSSCSEAMLAWSKRHRIRLLMTDYAHQRFENKLWFDAFLRRHDLPRPRGGVYTIGRRAQLPVDGPAVLQRPESMGGEGTFFVDDAKNVAPLLEKGLLTRGEKSLVRERIIGKAYGVTVFVAPSVVCLSPTRMQCYYPQAEVQAGQCFAGVQWVAASDMPELLRRRINKVFGQLGQLLYQRRFFGVANIDFMVDAQLRIFVLECNPRMSAATPQLIGQRALTPQAPIAELLLRGYLGPRKYPRVHSSSRLPEVDYRGATLEIVHRAPAPPQSLVRRTFLSGLYAFQGDRIEYKGPDVRALSPPGGFCLASFGRPGQLCHHGEPLGSILSNDPLFDKEGTLLPRARAMIEHFRYTDDRPGL